MDKISRTGAIKQQSVYLNTGLLGKLQTKVIREKGNWKKGDLSNEINKALEKYLEAEK